MQDYDANLEALFLHFHANPELSGMETRTAARLAQELRAEDFAYFITPDTGVKGVYFSIGGTPKAEIATAASHHSPLFKITPEPVIRSAVEAMTVASIDLLK